MLRWRAIHPYTAIHVIRIERPLDAARLSALIDAQLRARGLTGFALDSRRRRFEYTGGPAEVALAVHAAEDQPTRVTECVISHELNEPFARDGRLNPFRFFCIDSGSWFRFGVAYDHVVAGGDSIVVVIRDIVARYCGDVPELPLPRPFDRYPPTFGQLFLRDPLRALRGLRRVPEMTAAVRRAVRPRYPRGDDPANGFTYRRVDPPGFAALVRAAKAWGVTVNDMLVAILLQVLQPLAGEQAAGEKRRELAVASIVNLRSELGFDPDKTFGQFLSAFRVAHAVPPGISLQRLARDVHVQTARIKDEKLHLQTLLALGLTGVLWPFLSSHRRARFFAKNYPAWGAITLVNVDALWSHAGGRVPPSDYLRAVSTGPLAPLVVAVTTAGGVLHAGFSYRTAAFTGANIDKIADGIVGCFTCLDA